jgi:hypothetical protein
MYAIVKQDVTRPYQTCSERTAILVGLGLMTEDDAVRQGEATRLYAGEVVEVTGSETDGVNTVTTILDNSGRVVITWGDDLDLFDAPQEDVSLSSWDDEDEDVRTFFESVERGDVFPTDEEDDRW